MHHKVWADDQWLVENAGATLDKKDDEGDKADDIQSSPATTEETSAVSNLNSLLPIADY